MNARQATDNDAINKTTPEVQLQFTVLLQPADYSEYATNIETDTNKEMMETPESTTQTAEALIKTEPTDEAMDEKNSEQPLDLSIANLSTQKTIPIYVLDSDEESDIIIIDSDDDNKENIVKIEKSDQWVHWIMIVLNLLVYFRIRK